MTTVLTWCLAATGNSKVAHGDAARVLLWVGALLVLVVVLGMVIVLVRRRTLGETGERAEGGMLDELRRMRDRGDLSSEEYDKARASMVARLKGAGAPARGKPVSGALLDAPRVQGELRSRPGIDLTGAPLPKQTGKGPR